MSVKHLRPPWRPGESGNPLGVNRGVFTLAAEIRRQTGQGQTLVEFYTAMFEGRPIPVPGGRAQRPTLEHRHMAAQWLADRGWGKAKEIIELTGDARATTAEQRLALLRRLSDDERATLAQLAREGARDPRCSWAVGLERRGRPRSPRIRRRPRGRRARDARAPAQRRPRGRARAGGRRGVHGSSGQRRSGRRVPCRSPRSPGQARARIARSDGRRDRYPPVPPAGTLGLAVRPRRGPARAPPRRGPGGRAGGGTRACARERAPGCAPPGSGTRPRLRQKFFAVGRSIFGAPTRTSWRGLSGQSHVPAAKDPRPEHLTSATRSPGPPAGWVETQDGVWLWEHGVGVSADPSEPPTGVPPRPPGRTTPRNAHLASEAGSGYGRGARAPRTAGTPSSGGGQGSAPRDRGRPRAGIGRRSICTVPGASTRIARRRSSARSAARPSRPTRVPGQRRHMRRSRAP